jgi:hypothetical protein
VERGTAAQSIEGAGMTESKTPYVTERRSESALESVAKRIASLPRGQHLITVTKRSDGRIDLCILSSGKVERPRAKGPNKGGLSPSRVL